MECLKSHTKQVVVSDCEECFTKRNATELCFKRGFVWGRPDESEPEWVLSEAEGRLSKEDVSIYFDPTWEGNAHLLPAQTFTQKTIGVKQSIPPKIRWAVWERDNFTCQVCGARKYLSIDHIHPESKGGSLELSNLQTLCCKCNSEKGCRVV